MMPRQARYVHRRVEVVAGRHIAEGRGAGGGGRRRSHGSAGRRARGRARGGRGAGRHGWRGAGRGRWRWQGSEAGAGGVDVLIAVAHIDPRAPDHAGPRRQADVIADAIRARGNVLVRVGGRAADALRGRPGLPAVGGVAGCRRNRADIGRVVAAVEPEGGQAAIGRGGERGEPLVAHEPGRVVVQARGGAPGGARRRWSGDQDIDAVGRAVAVIAPDQREPAA